MSPRSSSSIPAVPAAAAVPAARSARPATAPRAAASSRTLALVVAMAALATLAVASAGCVVRARPRAAVAAAWDRLGERRVDGAVDRDVIHVGRDDGRYRRIKLVVEGSALEMYDVVVVFGDGQQFSPTTRLVFGRGTTSRTIDLPGGARVIRRVEFRYGNLPGGGRAHVVLWARR
ncbi:MAG: hypothetical protein H6709_11600 [Kofleriaceae bacterium]|nr:hypothetical protein [Kofleriaceae bacterium]MCB9572720.1 hypothetical protein [Kofleriaceae bacterium]